MKFAVQEANRSKILRSWRCKALSPEQRQLAEGRGRPRDAHVVHRRRERGHRRLVLWTRPWDGQGGLCRVEGRDVPGLLGGGLHRIGHPCRFRRRHRRRRRHHFRLAGRVAVLQPRFLRGPDRHRFVPRRDEGGDGRLLSRQCRAGGCHRCERGSVDPDGRGDNHRPQLRVGCRVGWK